MNPEPQRPRPARHQSWLLAVLVALLSTAPAWAQTITGRIDGRVIDSSGAVLPGATISIVNTGTGLTITQVTDDNGSYTATNLPVGNYTVTAELEGFRRAQRTGVQLGADGRLSADFTLDVGQLSESVQVQAVTGEAVNRTSGEVARTIDQTQIRDLAFNGRNYLELASLIPGAVATDFDPLALATSLSVTGQSINGNRTNTNNLTIDGTSNVDSGSNGSQVNNVSLSFIEEVKIQTSNFSAELGRNSGAAINVVTRSGTNSLRGTARYDFRDEKFDAPNYFAAKDASGNKIKPPLEFRNFEGAIGGPISRNKVFFFLGQQYRTINRFTSPTRQTIPTSAELNGNFALRLRGADGQVGTADDTILRDPTTGQPFPGNVIPQSRITTDGRAIAEIYRSMAGEAVEYADTPTANNSTFQLYNPFESRQDIVRIDFQATANQRIHGRYLHDEYNLIEPYGTFSNAALPTVPTDRSRPGTSYQVGHTYVISPTLINEAKVGAAWNGQRIKPQGDFWLRDTFGFAYPELFDTPGFVSGGIPNIQVSGGIAQIHGPSFALLSPTTDITVQDTLTWVRGAHSLRSGVAVSRNRKDQNGRGNYFGSISFNNAGNPNSTGNALADALLGNFRTYNEASADPVGFFRFTTYQAFVSDTWRVRENLSIEAGVRYEYSTPTYTQGNNLVNFDPSAYDPSQAVRVQANGLLVPGVGYRFNGLVIAGEEIPEDQRGRVELLTSGDYGRIPFGAPRGLYDAQHLFMPRFSFSYSLDSATVIRGGAGLFYDKPEGNVIFSQLNLPPVLANEQYENFNLSAPSSGAAGAIAAVGDINALDPNMQLPAQVNFSIGVQRELGGGYFVEATYVGNRGEHLIRQPDVNRAPFDALRANAARPSPVSVNALRPYAGYSAIRMRISDADSTYNSMQLYATKRRGDFQFTVSYTLGKALTNASGNGDNDAPEAVGDLDYLYGPATYDRRHAFVNTLTYRLPWLRDHGGLLEAIAGGWEVSSKYRFQSGQYFTATGNSSIGNRRADYTGAEIDIDGDELRWFNTDAFTNPPNDRAGTATVGQIEGPSFKQMDISMRKNFRFGGRYNITPIIDVFNLFDTVNFANFAASSLDANNAAFGTLTSAQPSRSFQFGVRFDF